MTVQDERTQNRQQLQSLLRELFQFDHADLDFGIYRIMREKRADVERFIEHELLAAVEEGLAHFQAAEREELEAQLAEKRQLLGAAALDAAGAVREKFQGLPVAQDYMRIRKQLRQLDVAEETEAQIFNDLWRFFSRYYDAGDFLTERRYSSRESKFCVPYNGEEVLLHWANRDQYYVKTSERFTDYRFTAGGYAVWFRLQQAEVDQDNVKATNNRYFVLRLEEPLAYDAERKALTISFEYRPLTEEEEAHYLGVYNAQQGKSSRRKTLDRSALCVALEVDILAGLDHADLKAHLAAVPGGKSFSILGQHLNQYTARNTMDYFVHKDLGGFLRRELGFFLKNEVLHIDDVVGDESGEVMTHVLTRMRVVRQIAERIIAFLAQIEDFQKRLFEKRKFVVQTHYCVTLDRVPESLYPEILANEAQLEEWRRLYNVDAWENDLFWRGAFDEAFLTSHPYVMVDTAFFDDDFKARLLASFDDPSTGSGQGLDDAIDGVLIHGENFQALKLLQAKYADKVKCIYIDPPYNTGVDEFIFKDSYQHSSWLTMMENRLKEAQAVMPSDSALFVSVDDNEQENLRQLASQLLGRSNLVANIIWQKKYSPQNDATWFSDDHDHILLYAMNKTIWRPQRLPRTEEQNAAYTNPDNDPRGPWKASDYKSNKSADERPNLYYPITNPFTGEEVLPQRDRVWAYSPEQHEQNVTDNRVWWGTDGTNSVPAYKRFLNEVGGIVPRTIWSYDEVGHNQDAVRELKALFAENPFSSPKPTRLVRKILQVASCDLVLDFFAGSGTTAHSVINLNREDGKNRGYILVEMGNYFDTVLKPRIQKVAFSASWKDGVPQDRDGVSHIFKYQRIESYEDALNNIRVKEWNEEDEEEVVQHRLLYEEFDDYQLHYMLDFETRDSPTLLAQEAFEEPFDYTLKIQRGHESPKDEKVDLVETFHYLIGMHVRRLDQHMHQDRAYTVSRGEVRTEHGVERTIVIWRDTPGLDLHQEADWANETLLTEPVDRVYVNGPSHIADAQPLEITFREKMAGEMHH
jgi:adenine-specific DNA-methyltransferase